MSKTQPDYLSYIIHLWRINGDYGDQINPAGWRASLENPHTGERKGFAGLDELFDFLQEQADVTLRRDSTQVINKQGE